MKQPIFNFRFKLLSASLFLLTIFSSCEKNLEQVTYDKLSETTFFKTEADAKASVTAAYRGIAWLWGPDVNRPTCLVPMTTDEGMAPPGGPPYDDLRYLNFREDFPNDLIAPMYRTMVPIVTETTITMDKIAPIVMDETLKKRLTAELKGLRAIYSYQIFSFYGTFTVPVDAKKAADPAAPFVPRPSTADMVAQIEKDYKEAAADLPARFTGSDYGRITSTACLTGLMKLYMHEKRWSDAVTVGKQIQSLGYSLMANYDDNFTLKNKGGNNEIILCVPATPETNGNLWLALILPLNYVDPSGIKLDEWDIFRMPWKTYDKFDVSDPRAKGLLVKYPTADGKIYDSRDPSNNNYRDNGATLMKYGIDPGHVGAAHGIDFVVWRYADVELMLAEAINETQGPNAEDYSLVKDIRTRVGMSEWPAGLSKDQFRNKMMDERLFELWCEGVRRDDLIRWGTYIQRAIDDGSTWAKPEFVLFPLPRQVITESAGIIKQNPGYLGSN